MQANPAVLDYPVHKVILDHKVHLDQVEHQDPSEIEVMVATLDFPDLQVLQDSPDRLDKVDKEDLLVLMARSGHQEIKDHLVQWVSQVRVVKLVPLDPKEVQALKDKLVTKGHPVILEIRVA